MGFQQFIGLGTLVAVGTMLSGCASTPSPQTTPTSATSQTSVTQTTYPLTVTSCGRTLTFKQAPKSISVDGERYALPLFAIGAGDRLTSVFSHYSGTLNEDFSVDPGTLAKLKALPSLVGTKESSYPSMESFMAAKPDLVIEAYNGDAGNGDPKGTDALIGMGIPVFTLSPSCSGATLENSLQDTATLGKILNLQDAANKVVADQKAAISAALAKANSAGNGTPSVFFLDSFGGKGEIYSNTGGFLREIVAAAGGKLVPANSTPDDIYTVSKEAVVASNPDIVVTYHSGGPLSKKMDQLWPLIVGSKAAATKSYVTVPYPDGAGTVDIVTKIADAVAKFKSAQ
jgi:iron complex transport system substrate-binding protein